MQCCTQKQLMVVFPRARALVSIHPREKETLYKERKLISFTRLARLHFNLTFFLMGASKWETVSLDFFPPLSTRESNIFFKSNLIRIIKKQFLNYFIFSCVLPCSVR